MRTSIGVAAVDTPTTVYGNVSVRLEADDDANVTAVIENRKTGVILETISGPYRYENGSWVIDLASGGVAIISKQGGCGCGGPLVESKVDGELAGNGYVP